MINRRTLLAVLTAVAFALAVLIQPPGRAYACSCLVSPPAAEARDQSVAVFSGQVRSIIRQTESSQVEVVFDLAESWKGPLAPSLTLRTAGSSASCGYEFVEGERYLVYANEQDGNLAVSLCSRTATLDDASADVAALGSGRPAPQVMQDVLPPQAPAGLLIALGAVALAGAAAYGLIRRRRTA